MIILDISYAFAYDMHMTTISDFRPAHRIAVQTSVDVVSAVTPDDLRLPTPCAGWDLGDLLAHMTVQHHGFAAAARGHGADLAEWDPAGVADAVSRDPSGTYAAAAADVLDAFAADDVLTRSFALPEFGPGATFPGDMAVGFHFVDYVVHSWDAAKTIDAPLDFPDDLIATVLPLALFVPDGEFRSGEGAPFKAAITTADAASDLERILLYLGRSPEWAPVTQR
jgi:uncharacterized protein (TIGR03086 family)